MKETKPPSLGRLQSGQMHETVNLASSDYGGSNPPLPTTNFGIAKIGNSKFKNQNPKVLDFEIWIWDLQLRSNCMRV